MDPAALGRSPRIPHLVALAVVMLAAAPRSDAVAPLASAERRSAFAHSIRAVPTTPTDAGGRINPAYVKRAGLQPEELAAPMRFEVALAMRNFDELEARLAHSEIIPPAEMQARYLPLAAEHDRVVRWLEAEGMTIMRTDANHLAVFARGSVAEVSRVFQTTFARIESEGAEFTSAITPPNVPSRLAPAIRGIHGLQPHQRLHRRPRPTLAPLVGSGSSLPYYPAQIAQAYNANTLGLTGVGQTIAVYALAFPRPTDLTSFWTTTGVAASMANIQNVKVSGGPGANTSTGSIQEATLDVEWASALAPGAVIRVYAADENDPVSDDELIQQILADLPTQPTLHQLTISFGADESTSARDYIAIEAQYMASLVSAGVTVFAASGDTGALGNNGTVQTGYPASMPDVTAVGGTTLILDSDGNVASESAWGNLANTGRTGASGGGISTIFSRPTWQNIAGMPAGAMRVVPDVAAVGDPGTGGLLVYNGHQSQIGGTSLSSPVWAAWCALINEARAAAGKPPLGALNPRIYPLAGTAVFRDITTGGNSLYRAGAGYDLCTGIGVPNVAALLQATMADSFAPVIEVQSGNRFTTTAQAATFYVVATGQPSPSFRWQHQATRTASWVDLADGTTFSGTGTYAVQVHGTTLAMNGDQFRCFITNAAGSITSQTDTLTVGSLGVSTLAGWPGWSGFADGQGSSGRFNYTGSVRVAADGTVYVADASNNTVRKITPAGVVSTLAGAPGAAGSVDGPGAIARFNGPAGVALDAAGSVFVADSQNYTIRKISAAGVVSTLAGSPGVRGRTDGTGSAASFFDPENLAIDPAGNLYIADGLGNMVRKVTPDGVVTTLAGAAQSGTVDGTGSAARFNLLAGIAVDAAGSVYVGDFQNNAVRKISAAGIVTTLAGSPSVMDNIDGPVEIARFNGPADVAIDARGSLYIADAYNCTVRRITLPSNVGPPVVTSAPQSQTAVLGTTLTLSVAVSGAAPFTYQWSKDGVAIGGATGASYTVPVATAATAGRYVAAIAGAEGTVTSAPAIVSTVDANPGRLVNLSVRTTAGAGAQTLTVGFVLAGPSNKTLLVRAGGPALATFGLTGTMGDPVLTLFGPNSSALIAGGNDNWNVSDTATMSSVGAFPLTPGSKDSALVSTLAPGAYSAQITSAGSATGLVLAEIYDVAPSGSTLLVNLSARAQVGNASNLLIAGFAISGNVPKTVLIRGIGPGLTPFGVTGTLTDPRLDIFDHNNTIVQNNDDWGGTVALSQAFAATGAFALPNATSKDAALLITLTPGSYTVQVSGVNGTTGIALMEIYETAR